MRSAEPANRSARCWGVGELSRCYLRSTLPPTFGLPPHGEQPPGDWTLELDAQLHLCGRMQVSPSGPGLPQLRVLAPRLG